MGIEHLAAVLDHSRKGGSCLVVLLVVASYSDQNGEWVADQATLQRRTHLRRRRVQQVLDELVAAGDLAVIPGDGRGRRSTYRLTIGPERAKQSAPFPEKGEAGCTLSAQKGAAECTLSAQKGAAECALSAPLSPPFLPHPPIPLNPPEKQETFGLRPLSGPQGAVFRINLLLEEAGVPLPSPAQIGLWSKTLGGIEPLLELLGRLVQSGLANKREPIAYVHELGLAVSALSQLNRELTRRSDPRPQLADLAESDAIGQHADQVAFVHRPEVYAPTTSFRNRSTPAPAGPEPV